ncbi:MAG: ATP-binding protein [Candidatus Aenigmatarchaeota archaeon]
MEEQNPWWSGNKDYTYEEWNNYRIKWIPEAINQINFEPFSLNFIFGPRQVGKTTAIKICIHDLLKKMDPKSIFYYSCDELIDYKELGEVLDNYISAREQWKIKKSVIFLDEITFVEDWWRVVKYKIDQGIFKNDVLVITGSASIELMKQREYFPGRRGKGRDIRFLPMCFSEYVRKFGNIEIKTSSINDIEEVRKVMKTNQIYSEKINKLFLQYLKTGGFPIPIKDFYEFGTVSVNSKKIYLDWLRNDWNKIGKNDKFMKEVISYILKTRLSPISWLGISKETSMNSPHTVQSYIESLEELFVLKVLDLISPDSKVLYKKNKKIHVTDPFLYHVFSYYTNQKIMEETIVESVLASHLSRISETFFWRNASEVDVISLINDEQVGFEVKWGFRSWRKPKHIKNYFLLTKENLAIFLASVDWNEIY